MIFKKISNKHIKNDKSDFYHEKIEFFQI